MKKKNFHLKKPEAVYAVFNEYLMNNKIFVFQQVTLLLNFLAIISTHETFSIIFGASLRFDTDCIRPQI